MTPWIPFTPVHKDTNSEWHKIFMESVNLSTVQGTDHRPLDTELIMWLSHPHTWSWLLRPILTAFHQFSTCISLRKGNKMPRLTFNDVTHSNNECERSSLLNRWVENCSVCQLTPGGEIQSRTASALMKNVQSQGPRIRVVHDDLVSLCRLLAVTFNITHHKNE